ncbi:glycoside hydrolase family 10 protein [Paenibacillus ferrarius]|uniref:glycoside hydrolase family 10 protein n=1 Tax=Paenibacillus ferrarius TaxID=1469647 RepID=UPI003D2AF623
MSEQEKSLPPEHSGNNELSNYLMSVPSRVAEARGIWYRPVEKSREEVSRTLDRVQAMGANELYLETWFWGYTIYPSAVQAARGIEPQHPAFQGWDPLEAFVAEAGRRGIAVHAWLDGFMVGVDPAGGPILRAYPEWAALTRKQAGSATPQPQPETGFFWLDVTNGNVSEHVLSVIREMAMDYQIAGINLDFMRLPLADDPEDRYCYSDAARSAFEREYGTDPLQIGSDEDEPLWQSWTTWIAWREDDFIANLYDKVKLLRPELVVSAAPEPGIESDLIANWSQHVDIVIPQAYHNRSDRVRETVELYRKLLPSSNLVYSGIYPMYVGLDIPETIEQVLTAHEHSEGTVMFALGQATDEAIRALRQGPWRTPAVSTGLFPLQAVQAIVQDVKLKIAEIYVPRHDIHAGAAKELNRLLDDMLGGLEPESGTVDVAKLEALAAALTACLQEQSEMAVIPPVVYSQLRSSAERMYQLLQYARIKLRK